MAQKLVFIGRLEDIAGAPERQIAAAATLGAVLDGLDASLVKALVDPRIRLAVNGDVVSASPALPLADGDEIAFLPPVSGG